MSTSSFEPCIEMLEKAENDSERFAALLMV